MAAIPVDIAERRPNKWQQVAFVSAAHFDKSEARVMLDASGKQKTLPSGDLDRRDPYLLVKYQVISAIYLHSSKAHRACVFVSRCYLYHMEEGTTRYILWQIYITCCVTRRVDYCVFDTSCEMFKIWTGNDIKQYICDTSTAIANKAHVADLYFAHLCRLGMLFSMDRCQLQSDQNPGAYNHKNHCPAKKEDIEV